MFTHESNVAFVHFEPNRTTITDEICFIKQSTFVPIRQLALKQKNAKIKTVECKQLHTEKQLNAKKKVECKKKTNGVRMFYLRII